MGEIDRKFAVPDAFLMIDFLEQIAESIAKIIIRVTSMRLVMS